MAMKESLDIHNTNTEQSPEEPMLQWFTPAGTQWQFKFGCTDYAAAREAAAQCSVFMSDDEDEHTDNVFRSCYNCMYRRWQPTSFQCYKRYAES